MGRKALLIAMLVGAFGCKAMTELKSGRCDKDSDCKSGICDPIAKVCVGSDASVAETLISQSDTPAVTPDTTVDGAAKKDGVGGDGEAVDAPAEDATVADTAILGCKTVADCPGTRSHCVANVCVECEGAEDCKDPGKAFCMGGTCVGCEQAGKQACGEKVCAPAGADAGGQCVECMNNGQCKIATAPVCEGNACVACTSSEQCKGKNKETPACLTSEGTCVGCVTKADCPSGVPECDTNSHTCVGCTTSLACLSGTPICSGGVCGKCVVSSQCKTRDPGTPVCDNGACVECSSGVDCKDPSKPNCDPSTKTCVGCVTPQNCSGATPICDGNVCKSCATATKTCKEKDPKTPACAAGGSCVECTEKDESACTGKKSMCNTKTSLCVQCLGNSDCGDTTPICSNNTCVACASPAECKAKDATTPACVASGAQAGKCVACTDNTTCSGQVCKPETNACVQCLADKDCADPTKPICDTTTNTCGKCATTDQCKSRNLATPVCLASGACVECGQNSDCTVSTSPICETNACRKCKGDDECVSGPHVCMPDGHCATDVETISVTTGGVLPATSDITGKKLLLVSGPVSGTIAWILTGRSEQMVIVGKNSATINAGFASGAIPLHVTGGDAYVRDLMFTASQLQGIKADGGGVIHLDRVNVTSNQGTGILIDGSRFEIKNTSVANNGTTGGAGIMLTNLSTITSGPKSIANTTATGNYSGVGCSTAGDAPSPAPTSVLVYGNAGGGEIGASCKFSTCGSSASAKSATCGAP